MTSERQVVQLVNTALEIEAQEAKEAGALGFTARSLVQATMPHSKPKEYYFTRKNGRLSFSMMANPEIGLPYGAVPRLLIAWFTSEVVRTKEREIVLGRSLSAFMRELGLIPSGGRWGSIPRLKDQMKRLFACTISCVYDKEPNRDGSDDDTPDLGIKNVTPIEEAYVWWDHRHPEDNSLFESKVILSEAFFNEIIKSPVPLDMRALKSLKGSPMALDIYSWLTYRMSYLHKSTVIPWEVLQMQFGAEYARTRDFKLNFKKHLKQVLTVYRDASALPDERGLLLYPSPTHIRSSLQTPIAVLK